MTFIPRKHENGGICCSAEGHLCEKCKAHFALTRTAELRTAIPAHPYAPPDSYEQQLAPMRAEVESHKPFIPAPVDPFDDPKYTDKPNSTPPDGFKIALDRDRQKKGQNR